MTTSTNRTLYGLRQSPWTERARWALDHHGLAYDYHEHVPMLGEILLRRKAGKVANGKKASVPLLAEANDEVVVMGSLEIAKHADAATPSPALFPRDREAEISRWGDVAEKITQAARGRVLKRLLASREAQKESLPSFVPGALRGVMAPSAGMAISFLLKKYGISGSDVEAESDRTIRPLLEDVRAALAKGGGHYLVGDAFSYADLAIASCLHGLKPREATPLGPATREAWTNDALARDFDDLLTWRDAIYAKHR